MSRVIVVEVPDSCDDDWLREQLRELSSRLESILEEVETSDLELDTGACLDIVDAMQEYAGY